MSTKAKISLLFPMSLVLFEIATYLANDMYLPSLPSLAKDFSSNQDIAQYTLLVWFLGSASMQLFLGPLSDRFGRKIIIVLGAVVFMLTSFICAITQNIELFLISRFLQGATICSVVVAGYAAIHESFDTITAIKVIAIMGSVSILAPAFGPLAGALVLEFATWREIFWILGFWGLVSFLLLVYIAPETNHHRTTLSLSGILSDYWAILYNRNFLGFTVSNSLIILSFISWIVESPFIIVETYQKSTLEFGIIQLFIFGAFIIGTEITRIRVGKYDVLKLVYAGQIIALIAALGLGFVSYFYEQYLYAFVAMMMLHSIGTALVFGPLHRLGVEASNRPMGRRMAVSSTFMNIFGVIATYLVTLLNDKTLLNLSMLISGGIFISVMLYWIIRPKVQIST